MAWQGSDTWALGELVLQKSHAKIFPLGVKRHLTSDGLRYARRAMSGQFPCCLYQPLVKRASGSVEAYDHGAWLR